MDLNGAQLVVCLIVCLGGGAIVALSGSALGAWITREGRSL